MVSIDWDYVKKQTLWSYEDLIKKLLNVLGYNFVQEHYNHSMKQAGLSWRALLISRRLSS
jgi:hypothetical protein